MTVSGVVIYLDDIDIASKVLSDESIGKVVRALCHHAEGQDDTESLSQAEAMLYALMCSKVDRDLQKVAARAAAGKIGGENNRRRLEQEKANTSKQKQTEANSSNQKQDQANDPTCTCTCTCTSTSNCTSTPSAVAEGGDGGATGAAAPSSGTASRFIPPTVEEVRRYCEDHGYKVDADQFVAHYESNGWKVGRNPMKSWRAAIQTWLRSGYNDRAKPAKPRMVHAQDYTQRNYTDSQLEGEMSPLLAEALKKVQEGAYENV